MFFVLYLINVFMIQQLISLEIGSKCVPNKKYLSGECRLITQCEPAFREVMETHYGHSFLRCSFLDKEEVVCCPTGSTTPITTKRGEDNKKTKGIAERECQKIVNTVTPPLSPYIIGGENASLGEFPHMAALGYEGTTGYLFQCGGSLVSDLFVVTAAHCIDTLDGSKPSIVRLGVIDISDKTFNKDTDVEIAEHKIFPQYTRRHKYHDLALLRLVAKVIFTPNLSPICLYTRNDNPTKPLTVTGWGKTNTTSDVTSDLLLKANVSIVPQAVCNYSYVGNQSWRKLPSGIDYTTQICASGADNMYDTCQGDSGGPLQGLTGRDGQYRLVGVTSFGQNCATSSPGVYTRIYHYLDWIESIVWA